MYMYMYLIVSIWKNQYKYMYMYCSTEWQQRWYLLTGIHVHILQWNLSIVETIWTGISVLIIEVSLSWLERFHCSICTCKMAGSKLEAWIFNFTYFEIQIVLQKKTINHTNTHTYITCLYIYILYMYMHANTCINIYHSLTAKPSLWQ